MPAPDDATIRPAPAAAATGEHLAPLRARAAHLAAERGLPPSTADRILFATPPAGEPRAAGPALPVDELGTLYERHLDLTDPTRSARKGHGAFYTDRGLVDPTVRRVLCDGGRLRVPLAELRVCDPAAGGGAFLLGVIRCLRAACPGATARELLATLHGVDVDPAAARVCRLALWLELGDPSITAAELERRIQVGDAIIGSHEDGAERTLDRACATHFAAGEAPLDDDAVAAIARRFGFCHWRSRFPGVFAAGGFDAVLGNPPWEIQKPDSRAFFTHHDPGYRARSKQEALAAQQRLFEANPALERAWHLAERDTRLRAAFPRAAASPFRHQGRGDANQYKQFVELAYLLLRDGGRLGLIVPSGLYTDRGCAPLRRLLLERTAWEWLFGFENRRAVFAIDNRFKFAVVIAAKGGTTTAIRTAFLRHDVADWADADAHAAPVPAHDVTRFSPGSLAILELRGGRDLEVCERVHAGAVAAGGEEWGLDYRREVDLTLDSARFAPRASWEDRGYRPDCYGRWLEVGRTMARGDDDADAVPLRDGRFARSRDVGGRALPLYEGRMIGAFDFAQKAWVRGRARSAVWRDLPHDAPPPGRPLEPQFLLPATELARVDPRPDRPKVGFMAIASATNERSMYAAGLLAVPCGNSVPVLRCRDGRELELLAVLNSLVYDWALRLRLGGVNLNRFVLDDTALPPPTLLAAIPELRAHVAALSWTHWRFAPCWLALGDGPWRAAGWYRAWAATRADRLRRRCIVDAVVAAAYGLRGADLDWILRGCARPAQELCRGGSELDPKGFWRIDRDRPPAERLPALVRLAFAALQAEIAAAGGDVVAGCRQFAGDGERPGWRLPPLDLGPELAPWQTADSSPSSWTACRLHAARLAAPGAAPDLPHHVH